MSWLRRLKQTFGSQADLDINEELRFHVDALADEYQRHGMPADAARQAALRRFGSTMSARERTRDQATLRWVGETIDDVRLGVRLIRRHPGFSVTVAATLALGIGATTAIFGIVHAVLLRPLPYAAPEQLVAVWASPTGDPSSKLTVPYTDVRHWQQQAHSVSSLAAVSWFRGETVLTGAGAPRALLGVAAGAELFPMLAVHAAIGRTFDDRDLTSGCVTVLAHRFWQTLGGDDRVVGRALLLNGQSCTVVGVMPPAFVFFPEPTDLWTLIAPAGEIARDPDAHVAVFGRLRPETSVASAAAELRGLAAASARERGAEPPRMVPLINPLHDEFTWLAGRNLRITLVVLFAAVSCLLAIACMNVSNLLLGRSLVRLREVAIRSAIGSTRVRLLRQLTTESLLLAILGASGGAILAAAALACFRFVNPVQLPPGADVTVSVPVLVFTASLGIATGVLFGLVPAWRVSAVNLSEVLGAGGRAASLTGRQWLSRALVVAQASMSLLLLVGAGLLVQSVMRFASAPLAFEPHGVFSYSVAPPPAAYAPPASRALLYRRLLDSLGAEPAVGDTALSTSLPPRGGPVGILEREGAAAPDPQRSVFDTQQQAVSERYFDVMRVPLRRGRSFGREDSREATAVCIVNDALARKYFGRDDAIGQRIRFSVPAPGNAWLTIVGVAGDEERVDVRQELGWVTPPIVYVPITQRPAPVVQLLVRPRGLLDHATIQRIAQQAEPGMPIAAPQRLDAVIADYFRYPGFRAAVLTGFAGVALLLATVGMYAVLAQAVAQRTRDIGIRMALGASQRTVVFDTLKEGMLLSTAGIGGGLMLIVPLKRMLGGLLYGVAPGDAATLLSVLALLITAGFCASYLPARRASRVDPIVALRGE